MEHSLHTKYLGVPKGFTPLYYLQKIYQKYPFLSWLSMYSMHFYYVLNFFKKAISTVISILESYPSIHYGLLFRVETAKKTIFLFTALAFYLVISPIEGCLLRTLHFNQAEILFRVTLLKLHMEMCCLDSFSFLLHVAS